MNSGAKKDCVILMILAILTVSILAYALYIPTLNANAFQSRIENLTPYEEVTYLGYVHLTTESQAYKVNSNEFMVQVGEEGILASFGETEITFMLKMIKAVSRVALLLLFQKQNFCWSVASK